MSSKNVKKQLPTSNGNKIKSILTESSPDTTAENMSSDKNPSTWSDKEKALMAIDQYLLTRTCKYDLLDELFIFLKQTDWQDTVFEFNYAGRDLIEVLGKPDINKIIAEQLGNDTFSDVLKMLNRLMEFLGKINLKPELHAEIERHHISNYSVDKEDLQKIEEYYYQLMLLELQKAKIGKKTGRYLDII